MSGFARGQKVWVEAEFVDDYRPNTDDVEVRVRWSDGVAQLIDVGVSTISTTPPIPVGEVPPWMEQIGEVCGKDSKQMIAPLGALTLDACSADFPVYRLAPKAES